MEQINPDSKDAVKPPHVFVADTYSKTGRGVFSQRRFSKGETVELSPVFVIKEKDKEIPTAFRNRVFNWSNTPYLAIALGYGSLYNHRDTPNLQYDFCTEINAIRFIALRDIDPREELTINYTFKDGKVKEIKEDWFEKHGIEKHEG